MKRLLRHQNHILIAAFEMVKTMVYTPYIWPQILAIILMAALALYIRYSYDAPSTRSFIRLMCLSMLWTLLYTLNISTVSLWLKTFWHQLQMLVSLFIPFAILMLALEYIGEGHWLTRKRLLFLLGIPAVILVLLLVSPYHALIRYNFRIDFTGPFPMMLTDKGPCFWIYLAYMWGILLSAYWLLLRAFRPGTFYFWNAVIIAIGLIIPLVANMLYQFKVIPLSGHNWANLAFAITSLLYVWAISRRKLFDVVPVARNMIMEAIDDLVIVLDEQNRIVDFNRAAQATCGLSSQSIGTTPDILSPIWADLFQKYLTLSSGRAEVILNSGKPQQIYDLTISSIQDRRGNALGRLFLWHNITALKQADTALRKSEEKFSKAFHSSPDAILITRLRDGRIVEVNEGFCQLTEYSREEALGSSTIVLRLWANAKDRARVATTLRDAKTIHNYECGFITKFGKRLQCLYSGETIELDSEPHALSVVRDITAIKRSVEERESLIAELQNALSKVKQLEGILPTCCFCKRIRDEKGQWHDMEVYIHKHSQAEFSHGLCPECAKRHYPDYFIEKDR